MSVRRQPSAPWSRLKPVTADPLESIGLPSKGDNRLLNHKAQEQFFNKIVDRYMEFCAAAGRKDNKLEQAFASLSVAEKVKTQDSKSHPEWPSPLREELDSAASGVAESVNASSGELGVIMMAMRKLREGLLASGRVDGFAQSAYIFIARAAILTSTWESYQPALLHLLNRIHPVTALSASELREFVGYHILDLACRLGQYSEAFTVRAQWAIPDSRVDEILRAVVRDDWVRFWRLYSVVDGYQRRLMRWAEDGVRKHALKCLGKSYLSVDKAFVEATAFRPWEALKEQDSVGWELENGKVIIRRIKKK